MRLDEDPQMLAGSVDRRRIFAEKLQHDVATV